MKIVNTSRFLSLDQVFTGRNEVVAKVMFLHVSVILSTGMVSRQGEPPGQGAPPRTKGEPPPDQGEPPRTRENPPGTGRTPHPGPGRHPPRPGRTPHPPPGKQTPEYCLRAASTHPTAMHSCSYLFFPFKKVYRVSKVKMS